MNRSLITITDLVSGEVHSFSCEITPYPVIGIAGASGRAALESAEAAANFLRSELPGGSQPPARETQKARSGRWPAWRLPWGRSRTLD